MLDVSPESSLAINTIQKIMMWAISIVDFWADFDIITILPSPLAAFSFRFAMLLSSTPPPSMPLFFRRYSRYYYLLCAPGRHRRLDMAHFMPPASLYCQHITSQSKIAPYHHYSSPAAIAKYRHITLAFDKPRRNAAPADWHGRLRASSRRYHEKFSGFSF